MWLVRKERQQQCCNDFIHAPLLSRRARGVHTSHLLSKNKHVHTRHAEAPALCPFKMQASYVLPTKLTQYCIPSVSPPEAVVAPAWPDSPIGQNKQQFLGETQQEMQEQAKQIMISLARRIYSLIYKAHIPAGRTLPAAHVSPAT